MNRFAELGWKALRLLAGVWLLAVFISLLAAFVVFVAWLVIDVPLLASVLLAFLLTALAVWVLSL